MVSWWPGRPVGGWEFLRSKRNHYRGSNGSKLEDTNGAPTAFIVVLELSIMTHVRRLRLVDLH
jgi:hypothetical protein